MALHRRGEKIGDFWPPEVKGGPRAPRALQEASGGRERGLGGRCAGRVRATKWQGPDQRRNERSDFRADSSRGCKPGAAQESGYFLWRRDGGLYFSPLTAGSEIPVRRWQRPESESDHPPFSERSGLPASALRTWDGEGGEGPLHPPLPNRVSEFAAECGEGLAGSLVTIPDLGQS